MGSRPIVLVQFLQVVTLFIDAALFEKVDGTAAERGVARAVDDPGIEQVRATDYPLPQTGQCLVAQAQASCDR